MKKILLLSILLFSFFTNAQISFEKGYFISNNGKRTECFIKNADWKNNPIDFKYKANLNDNDYITETINTVQEFGFENNTIFKRAKVQIDRSSDDLEKVSQTGKPVWQENILFLETVVQGDATLYYYRDGNLIRYFYETKEVPLEQLIYLKYIEAEEENASKDLKENNYFKQQLNINVKSSNITNNDIKKLKYTKSDLAKYFAKYNQTTYSPTHKESKPTTEDVTKPSKRLFFIKVTPGVSFTTMEISSNSLSYRNITLENKTNFKIGLETEYILPFNKNKWGVFLNPTYQKYENDMTFSVPGLFVTSPKENHSVTVKYTGIQVPLGIRHYMFLNETSKIFINASFTFDISGKSTIVFDNSMPDSSRSGSNLAFGLGYNYKNKISIETRFNTKKELMADYSGFSAKYGAVDLIFAYTVF